MGDLRPPIRALQEEQVWQEISPVGGGKEEDEMLVYSLRAPPSHAAPPLSPSEAPTDLPPSLLQRQRPRGGFGEGAFEWELQIFDPPQADRPVDGVGGFI